MITQQERDKLFFKWLSSRDIKVDVNNGTFTRSFKKKIKEIGIKYDNQWEIRFFIENKNHAISRARAIWLIANGEIQSGKMIIRISDDSYDDSLTNLKMIDELAHKRDIGKKGIDARIKNNVFKTKLTLESANEIRRMAASKEYSYQQIADKFGVSKQTAMSCAFGETWKDASEKPVESGRAKNTVKRVSNPAPKPKIIKKTIAPVKLKSKIEVLQELYAREIRFINELLKKYKSAPSAFQLMFILDQLRENDFRKITDDDVIFIIKHYS